MQTMDTTHAAATHEDATPAPRSSGRGLAAKIGAAALSLSAAGLIATAAAPTADASTTKNYWWGSSTWYSKSDVKKLQPAFRRVTDIAALGGGGVAGGACAALLTVGATPGAICGALVGLTTWHIQEQASKLDYAASNNMCARLDTRVKILTVTPYSCGWK